MNSSELVEKIKINAQKYYQGEDCIPDAEFDLLVEELRKIDPDNEVLSSVGWGYDLAKNHKIKTEHLGEAYGISNKVYVDKTSVVNDLAKKVKTGKIDGGSVELVYYLGKLMKAVSRGNGRIGVDVTHIAKYIVPCELPFSYTGNFLGEFVLPDDNMNQEDSIAQRNIPNGFLQRDSATEEECSRFLYVPYKINRFKPLPEFSDYTRVGVLKFIQSCGFNTITRVNAGEWLDMPYEDMIDALKSIMTSNGMVRVPLDGIVGQSDKIIVSDPDEEGYCTISYIDEVAYKTVNDKTEVVVDNIDWNLTRTGKLVPTVEFEPVELSGAEVHRATAFNAQYIIDTGIGVGSKIEVIRSGEVIPYISDIIESRNLDIPKICPVCQSELKREGVHLVCNNPDCSGKSYHAVKHWINTLGSVDNLGPSMISDLIDYFDLNSIHDLYDDRFSFHKLSQIEGFGKSKIQVVVNMFKKLFEPKPLNHVLVALNIPGLSYETAYKIVEGTQIEYMIMEELYDEDILVSEMKELKGVSSTTIDNYVKYSDRLFEYLPYVKLMYFSEYYKPKKQNKSENLLKIYATGKFEHYKNRDTLYSDLADKVVKESNIKNCDYFVTNKQPLSTNHYKTAVENGIKIISEEELLNIVR